ncbi:hypothetical protein [Streptomyces liangshanensis]|uniref:Sensor domain-containing protein n=1 Tax=Streptomyces liangshanensis TaxID=2717324 RepID=A0A6G9H3B1_9ACTN|nr:hypothetical protein [Streptomyces liangshanensis]QIQ04960.1 hypothetical protein HA039_24180 [Streptomyces liangshanensis]
MSGKQAIQADQAIQTHQATDRRFARRGRTAGAAVLGAALLALALGAQPATADARTGVPGGPAAAPAAQGLGSGHLLQRRDLVQRGLRPVGATVGLTGNQALSACSGEETMRALVRGTADAYAEVTWTFDTRDTLLIESVAEGSTDTSAALHERELNQLVRDCQDEPAGHWYYGTGHALTTKAGRATWYPAFSGGGEVSGGVAVIRSGHRFGLVEIAGQPGDDPAHVAGLAAAALDRLAS